MASERWLSIKNCGLVLDFSTNNTAQDILDWAVSAEKDGYGYVFRGDHIASMEPESKVERPECWVTLGALAASTHRVKFGPLVTPIGFRNPALLARMACTLHSYSSGRLVLGLGAGWLEEEYLEHGMAFPPVKTRVRQLYEALQIIRALTTGKRVDFDGRYYSAHVEVYPKPHNGKIHLIGGGSQPRVIKILSRFVDELNLFYTPVDNCLKLRDFIDHAGSVSQSYMAPFIIAENEYELQKRMKWYGSFIGFSGSIEQLRCVIYNQGLFCGVVEGFVQQVNERRKIGTEKFYFQVLNPSDVEMKNLLTETIKSGFK
jgi:alkanesulfonate monooxygenase SsuD/methylene tetrahydromethanopterin reductase-like flavin-dependent oxidoreductase (luciferase family)